MTLEATEVMVGVTGEAFFAAAGTTLPTDSSTALPVAFAGLGYNTESGINETVGQTITKLRAWQNADVVRTLRTEHDVEYAFDLMQTNAATLEAYYGVGTYSSGVVQVKSATGKRGVWVIEVIDGTDVVRVVIPDGEVSNDSTTISHVNDGAITYPITITCYPDDSGVKAYKYYGALS